MCDPELGCVPGWPPRESPRHPRQRGVAVRLRPASSQGTGWGRNVLCPTGLRKRALGTLAKGCPAHAGRLQLRAPSWVVMSFARPASTERRAKITTAGTQDMPSFGCISTAKVLVGTALVIRTAGFYLETETRKGIQIRKTRCLDGFVCSEVVLLARPASARGP